MVTGNRNILNSIKGITSVVKLTAEEKTALADRVLPANVLVVDSSNIVYLTDGVTAVKALNPLLASSNNYAYDKDVVHLTGDETIAGTKTFSAAIVGSVTGNAGSATKLATARTINGTSFNGTANITTANWGTARNISITDGTNTSTAVSVNGSANVSLKLPATIKANLTGNSDTATKATQDSDGNQINTTYSKVRHTHDDRYYTETEVNNLLDGKANTSGTYSNLTVGNAGSATNATYANWLRTSSHSDHLFHTEWDKAGYFWTYVTAGNGDYRAVRVARSDSAATAQACTGNSATATKLATARTIALSGAATGTATSFDGTANIAIPITSLDASKLTGTASVSTTGNAATATTATTAKSCTGNAATATKATQDSAGQQIDTTYIKSLAVSGRTITYTKGDNTTGTITTQDTNTDTKVTQTATTTNAEYPVLFSADANKTATSTTTARFSSNTKINPSTNTITATTFKGNLTGNVTGNASTATTATNATNAAKLNNIASSGYVQTGKVNQTINGTKTFSAAIASSIKTNTYIDGNKGVAIINSTAPAGYNMLYRIKSTNGVFTGGVFNQNYELHYTVDTTIAANTNAVTYTTTLMNEAGDATFAKNVTIGVGLTVKGDANFANITTSYIAGLFTE